MNLDVFIPYAVFCDEFTQSADGSVSITRIIDTIKCFVKSFPATPQPITFPMMRVRYAICFKAAVSVPNFETELRCIRPSGRHFVIGTRSLGLAGDYAGAFLTGELEFQPQEEGWHVFEIVVGQTVEAKIPLRIEVLLDETVIAPSDWKQQLLSRPSERQCYAHIRGDCKDGLSKEHFISKNILEEIHKMGGLRVHGLPWQKPGEALALSPTTLNARVLCKHHNESLSELDQAGGSFFRTLLAMHAACMDGSQIPGDTIYEFDGHKVERFLLKILIGGLVSGNLEGPQGASLKGQPELSTLGALFGEAALPEKSGLFLLGEIKVPWFVGEPMGVAAIVHDGKPAGVLVNIAPLRFALTIAPEARDSALVSGKSFYRPTSVTVGGPDSRTIKLNWNDDAVRVLEVVVAPVKEDLTHVTPPA
jgi:hypothetical protein